VARPQGRHGEVAAELHTDFPERFAERKRVFALLPGGQRRELRVEEFWPHKGRMVLKFAGVDSISQAEALAGCEIQIPRSERAKLEPGSVYAGDLIGCEVIASGATVGKIDEVQFGAGDAPLLVIRQGRRELMIPFAEAYLKKVDLSGRRVEMELPEGMLELDAPLSRDEKAAQQRKE